MYKICGIDDYLPRCEGIMHGCEKIYQTVKLVIYLPEKLRHI